MFDVNFVEVSTVSHAWPERSAIPSAAGSTASLNPARRPRRAWMVLCGLMLAVLAIVIAVNSRAIGTGGAYQSALVGRHNVEETVVATGRVRPRAHVDVGARVSGQLRKLHVRIGSLVREGDLLAEIDAEAQEAKVEGIRAELARLSAELAELEAVLLYAERQHGRLSELSRTNAASQAKEDEAFRDKSVAKARRDSTIAKIRQTEASLKAERVALGYTRILAPMSGTVISIEAVEGQTLNANYEAPEILRIADLAVMTIWTDVSESDVTKLSVGMPVSFTTLGHIDRTWQATLREILPAPQRPPRRAASASDRASPGNNVIFYVALFDITNGDQALRVGMTAQVSFVYARAQNAIAVPTAALQVPSSAQPTNARAATGADSPRRAQVHILNPDDGSVSLREIVTGVRGPRFVEVTGGVAIGERVVTGEARRPPRSGLSFER
jgi:macrolide-specific efflux system membrane fusion protein